MNQAPIFIRRHTPRWIIYVIDMAIVVFSIAMAYLLRFNFSIPATEVPLIKYAAAIIVFVRAITFFFAKTYVVIIRHTSVADMRRMVFTCVAGTVAIILSNGVSFYFYKVFVIPFSVVIIEFLLTVFLTISARSFIKLFYDTYIGSVKDKSRVLIFGAGEAGLIAKHTIDKDLASPYYVVGFVDDDKNKVKRKLENKPIYNGADLDTVLQAQSISHIIISAQQITKSRLNSIIETCLNHNVQVRHVPPANKWINGELSLRQIREFRIEDLLGRDPIKLSEDAISRQLQGRTILITGAAGSIGSEITRQVLRFSPARVVLLDQAESALYEFELELQSSGHSGMEIVIGDVRNRSRMENIFRTFKPDIVYHAAAYKHVPLMENNPSEAVLANIQGTCITAELAAASGVVTFVLVSTDKAVNPTNVMGASKRIAEIFVQALNSTVKTNFITTRFGNVLGSNGSVIPLFKRQIDQGGPITVTHPDITRYFMTIPEACQLVLEAGAWGKGGEIFIFDMGKSIRIKDLASNMIKLSGLEEGKDIQVVYSGLRPGEKLYEELLNDKENTLPTHHPQIMIARVREYAFEEVAPLIKQLTSMFDRQNNEEIVILMKKLVPEYQSQNSPYMHLDKHGAAGQ